MLHFKVFIGLCLLAPSILALRCSEPVNVMSDVSEPELEAFQQVSYEDSELKINWSPVWEDVQGSNEFVSRTDDGEEDKCKAPNGLGLKNLLRQIAELQPKENTKIIESLSKDPEIIALRAFGKNPETKMKLNAIEHSQEFKFLKDYSCRVLHLNLETYHNKVSYLINPTIKRDDQSEQKGIKGLANALEAVVPKQKLRELYDNLMKTDDELVKAVAHLKSDEFHQLLLNVKNLREYQELRQELVSLGLPVDEMHNLLGKVLGWSSSVGVLF